MLLNSGNPKKSRVKVILYFASIASIIGSNLIEAFKSFHNTPLIAEPPLKAIFDTSGVLVLSVEREL